MEVFEAAARELGVTPPAVSRHLRNLEERLGISLFEHSARPARPTAAARELLPTISGALDQMDDACRRLAERRGGRRTVSVLSSVAAAWLASRAAQFQREHPDILLTVHSEDELTDFHRGHMDAALRYGGGDYAGVHSEKLLDEIATPFCSPGFLKKNPARNVRDLPGMALINDVYLILGARRAFVLSEWRGWLAAMNAGREPENIVITTTQANQALRLAISGEGVVLARGLLSVDDLKSGVLVAPLDFSTWTGHGYYFVCLMSARNRPSVQRFAEWLRAEFAAHKKDVEKHFPPPRDFPDSRPRRANA